MPGRRARIVKAGEVERREGEGVLVEVVAPELSGATGLWMARFVAESGFGVPRHYHTVDTVAYLVRGRAAFRIGEDLSERLEMEPGDYVFVPKDVVHTEETLGGETAEFLLVRDGGGGESVYLDE